MWILTGFADEISPDFNEQLDTLRSVDVDYLELRSVEKQGVLTLSDEKIAAMKQELQRRGIRVSSIGSPIGKIDITEPFEPHFRQFQRALAVADVLEAPYIRIFSFWIPEGRHADYRNEVMDRLAALAQEAQKRGVKLVHEN